jgi:hypothetical protein
VSELERAEAVAAFLAWPGPGHPTRGAGVAVGAPARRVTLGTHALASLLTLLIGCTLAVCSLAFPLAGAAGQPWASGSHLLLFCHLTL